MTVRQRFHTQRILRVGVVLLRLLVEEKGSDGMLAERAAVIDAGLQHRTSAVRWRTPYT